MASKNICGIYDLRGRTPAFKMNIGALLAGLFSGIIGGMGLGGGAVLIIYLTVFKNTEQLRAQGINLLFFKHFCSFLLKML